MKKDERNGQHSGVAIPVDKYIEYTTKTYDFDPPESLDEDFSFDSEPYADEYASGRRITCVHCNTAFRSARREPKCPFCHKRPA